MSTADINGWIDDVKAQPGSETVGMILVHQGIVRGTSRSGDPVRGMQLGCDRERLNEILDEAGTWPGVFAARAWVNEGALSVGDDIMKVLVAGDIREHVFAALQQVVSLIKTNVLVESETT